MIHSVNIAVKTNNNLSWNVDEEEADICLSRCPNPTGKCNGECEFFKSEKNKLKNLRQTLAKRRKK